MNFNGLKIGKIIHALKLTNIAPENRPFNAPKGNSSSNHPFSGAEMLVSGRVFVFS